MTKKTIFIADAHIKGHDDPEMKGLIAFFDSLHGRAMPERLVMLGDIFDFWTGSNRVVMREYALLLESLARLRTRGAKITFVEGNHDFSMGDFFTKTLGADVHQDSCELSLDDKRVYVAHGDKVGMTFGYWLWRSFLRSPVFTMLTKVMPPESVWAIAKYLSTRSRGYGKKKPSVERNLKAFAERKLQEGFDACVLGHSHTGGVHPGPGKNGAGVYANAGGWVNEKSYLEYSNGAFELKTVK
jgi:UDP-2,3-diacylglucosamine hydrolase